MSDLVARIQGSLRETGEIPSALAGEALRMARPARKQLGMALATYALELLAESPELRRPMVMAIADLLAAIDASLRANEADGFDRSRRRNAAKLIGLA